MILLAAQLASLSLSLLAADPPALPPNHPQVQPGQLAPPLEGNGQMPHNHPAVKPGTMAPPLDENGQLVVPANHPPMKPGTMAPPLDENGQLVGSAGAAGRQPATGPFAAPAASPPGPSNEELLRQAEASGHLKDRDKPFDAALALGKLYFVNGRFAEAAEFLRQAEEKGEPLRVLTLDVRKKNGGKPIPTPVAAGCEIDKGFKLEAMFARAQEKAKAGQTPAALSCAQVASMPLQEAIELRARALFIEGVRKDALAEYERLVELAPERTTALYGRALTRIDWDGDDLPGLKKAQADLVKVAQVWKTQLPPEVPKWQSQVAAMIEAGGATKLMAKRAAERKAHPVDVSGAKLAMHPPMESAGSAGAGGPPQLTKEMVDAVQNTEHTPELEAGLAKLVEQGEDALAKGQFQDALDAYKRVVPFQPENGRAKAGMAWALVGLGKPMADRIWTVAVSSDPAAVDGLGRTLASKGNAQGAKALWAKLASSDPGYASKANLAARIQ